MTVGGEIHWWALTAKPIPLQYFYAITIKLLVEPASGTIVDTLTAVRSYSVRPYLAPFAAGLAPMLAAHPTNLAVAPLAAGAQSGGLFQMPTASRNVRSSTSRCAAYPLRSRSGAWTRRCISRTR